MAVALLIILAVNSPIQADITLITSRSDIGATDSIDWSQGGTLHNFDTLSSPHLFNSADGVAVTVSKSGDGVLQIREQNGTLGGWVGNFNTGDTVLWTQAVGGTITLDFGQSPIRAGGAQFQPDFFGNFTAMIEAVTTDGMSHSFTKNGFVDDTSLPGTAIFIGVGSTTGSDISKITFSLFSSDNPLEPPNDFAINFFSFDASAGPGPGPVVPEPGSLILLGVGILGLVGYRWRRHKDAR
jgi:hypothetical protein